MSCVFTVATHCQVGYTKATHLNTQTRQAVTSPLPSPHFLQGFCSLPLNMLFGRQAAPPRKPDQIIGVARYLAGSVC